MPLPKIVKLSDLQRKPKKVFAMLKNSTAPVYLTRRSNLEAMLLPPKIAELIQQIPFEDLAKKLETIIDDKVQAVYQPFRKIKDKINAKLQTKKTALNATQSIVDKYYGIIKGMPHIAPEQIRKDLEEREDIQYHFQNL